MSRWVERAACLEGAGETCANSANRANRGPATADPVPNGTNDTIGTAPLPASVVMGLRSLAKMAAPRVTRPEVWPEIVADALNLASEGWAVRALSLGWSPLNLWGCSPLRGDEANPDHDGLAVRLCGRRLILLDDSGALIDAGGNHRARFSRRHHSDGAIFLWELGR